MENLFVVNYRSQRSTNPSVKTKKWKFLQCSLHIAAPIYVCVCVMLHLDSLSIIMPLIYFHGHCFGISFHGSSSGGVDTKSVHCV